MIYICTHKDFQNYPKGEDFRILSSSQLNDQYDIITRVVKNKLAPMEFSYAELYHIFDVWKAKKKDEWVGINHYRRYFDFGGAEHNMTTLPVPRVFNMHDQYARCHNLQDLLECEAIIDEMFPEYHCDYTAINHLYTNNMFVLGKEDFDAYCKFVFGVLDKFNKNHGFKTTADVEAYVSKNRKFYNHNRTFDAHYQARLQGFLAERIGTIFFDHYFKGKDVRFLTITMV